MPPKRPRRSGRHPVGQPASAAAIATSRPRVTIAKPFELSEVFDAVWGPLSAMKAGTVKLPKPMQLLEAAALGNRFRESCLARQQEDENPLAAVAAE